MANILYTLKFIRKLHDDFNTQRIEKSSWTHEAHLLVALSYVKSFEEYETLCRLKAGIILLNHTHGTINDEKGGYHETLTHFWAKITRLFSELHPDYEIERLANSFFLSALFEKNLPLVFYKKNLLMSAQYRAIFVAPELLPLNEDSILRLINKVV